MRSETGKLSFPSPSFFFLVFFFKKKKEGNANADWNRRSNMLILYCKWGAKDNEFHISSKKLE